jgi:uncharacterized membrane protein
MPNHSHFKVAKIFSFFIQSPKSGVIVELLISLSLMGAGRCQAQQGMLND